MPEPSGQILLHLGAHRTGSTSLQAALHGYRPALSAQGIGYWGPQAMRHKRFPGLFRAYGTGALTDAQEQIIEETVAANTPLLARRMGNQQRSGHSRIILSEENLIGVMRVNYLDAALYPDARHRLIPVARIFAPHCRRISLTIRSYDTYWPSLIAYRAGRGGPVPMVRKLNALAMQQRRWQHLIEDILAAFPLAEVRVMDFERWAGHPAAHIEAICGAPLALPAQKAFKRNASPNKADLYAGLQKRGNSEAANRLGDAQEPYRPFSRLENELMQASYAEDLAWLRRGGIARLQFLSPGDTG